MPPPTVQPVRVSLASNCSLNTGMNAEYLSPAHAAPPLAYNSQRSHAQPNRPVALAIQSVWACAVPVIPRTVRVISPLLSLPDPSPSMLLRFFSDPGAHNGSVFLRTDPPRAGCPGR